MRVQGLKGCFVEEVSVVSAFESMALTVALKYQ